MIFNVAEAKANLSKLINMAFHGEEVVIAKNNLPLVELVVHKPKSKIVFGLLAAAESDGLDEGENLLDEDEELNELFYSGEIDPK
jgi:prevent-host-death family protein